MGDLRAVGGEGSWMSNTLVGLLRDMPTPEWLASLLSLVLNELSGWFVPCRVIASACFLVPVPLLGEVPYPLWILFLSPYSGAHQTCPSYLLGLFQESDAIQRYLSITCDNAWSKSEEGIIGSLQPLCMSSGKSYNFTKAFIFFFHLQSGDNTHPSFQIHRDPMKQWMRKHLINCEVLKEKWGIIVFLIPFAHIISPGP